MQLDFEAMVGLQRVMDCNGRVSIRSSIDDDRVCRADGFLYPLDQLPLEIRLSELDIHSEFGADFLTLGGDTFQRLVTVNFRLPGAEQVEVGSIDDDYFHGNLALQSPCDGLYPQ